MSQTNASRAAVLQEPKAPVEIREIPVREPGPGEVLVRMEACGLCHSDLFVSGLERLPHLPLVLGHEGVGRVEAAGPDAGVFVPGERVGITFLASTCGSCEPCGKGRRQYCSRQLNFGYTADGALSTWATLAAGELARVPASLPAHQAAPLCCAGWTAYAAVRESGLEPGQSIALFGMGGLGHLAVQYARIRGLRVAAVDTSEPKLVLARKLGAEIALSSESAGRTLQKEYGGVDAAVVLTASAAAIDQAFRSVKRTGILVLVGLPHQSWELPVVDAVLKGITIRGSYLGTASDLAEVFRLAELGAVRPQVETYDLAETPALLERMARGQLHGRAVITF